MSYMRDGNFMKKNQILLGVLMTLFPIYLFGQNDSIAQKKMLYSTGYSHYRVLDKQFSPLIYQANMFNLGIGFEKQKTEKRIFSCNMQIWGGWAKSKHFGQKNQLNEYFDASGNLVTGTVKTKFASYQLHLSAEYLRKIKLHRNIKCNLFVGGQLSENFFLLYHSTYGLDMPSFINEVSLCPSARIYYQINENLQLKTEISIPVVALITRLPYSNVPMTEKHGMFLGTFETCTRFTSIHKYQRIAIEFGTEKTINDNWNIGLNYGFMWLHYPKEFPIKSYNNMIRLSFNKKLNIRKCKNI
jgi:hypothetical protein